MDQSLLYLAWGKKNSKDMLGLVIIFIYYFIMQKVIQRSLRTTIIQEISQLNIANAQFYALLRKLSANQHRLNQTFSQKLEVMKTDIKNKLRQLASNVDLMYQMLDRKISTLIHKMQENSGEPSIIQQQLRSSRLRIQELEQESLDNRNKYNLLLSQNQYLKTKNIALIQQIDILSKKKATTLTNDSRNMNHKTDNAGDNQNSMDNYLSPIQQPVRPPYQSNDLTFNKNMTVPNNMNKKIKSEQNSFSSLLIKQQNSFEPSYGSDRPDNKKFTFGCMPAKNTGQTKLQFQKNTILKQNSGDRDQNHRMSFLISNLKDTSNESFSSEQSSRYHFSREESNGKSVLSKGVVKKYHI